MPLQYRKTKAVGRNTRVNVSKGGVSLSQRVGPLTLNTRGRASLRLGRGVSFRFGKNTAGIAAVVALSLMLALLVVQVTLLLVRTTLIVSMWLARWAWFGTLFLIDRRRATIAASDDTAA